MTNVAVVTPYFREPDEILMRCHDSVLGQTVPCTHLLVADGFPRDLFDQSPRTSHTILPRPNGDVGNTPRAVGGILADAYGFDAVAYLDADNWYEPDHIQNLLAEHETSGAPLISCRRKYYHLDGRLLDVTEPEEDDGWHVDTSCWLIFRPAFAMLRTWLMPKRLGSIGDRIFLKKALHERYRISMTDHRTVGFQSQYAAHYQAAGIPAPDGLKEDDIFGPAREYLLSLEGVIEITEALGFYPSF